MGGIVDVRAFIRDCQLIDHNCSLRNTINMRTRCIFGPLMMSFYGIPPASSEQPGFAASHSAQLRAV